MYDKGKIITGLIIFVGLFASPIWYNLLNGKDALKQPDLVYPSREDQRICVADSGYMRSNHMALLNEWRFEVVRNGKRIYTSYTNKNFDMSLTKTCMNCHSNASQFCDQCHNYVGASIYCWDCHANQILPESKMISKNWRGVNE